MEELRALELRVRLQEEDHRRSVQQEVRRVAAELAEKEHQDRRAREQEDLDRQAATTETPEEQVQVQAL
eukprot:2312687-Amphidinium_carterae.2